MFRASRVAACWWLTTQQSLDCGLPAPFESFHSFKTFQKIQDFENSFKIDTSTCSQKTREKTPEYVKCVKDLF